MTQTFVHEPARETPVLDEAEVVVLGGGPSGIAAAGAAARGGCKTLLIERYGFLGGMGTAAGVTNFCGLHANVHGEIRQVVHGIADDLLARMRGLGGLNEPHVIFNGKIAAQAYDNAAFKIAADDVVTSSGARVLFHALAAGVALKSETRIDALIVETKSGRRAIRANSFIDCSGDADLATHAGAPFEKATNLLYPTAMFRVNNVDAARAREASTRIPELMQAAEKKGRKFPRKSPIVRPQKNPTEWRVNVTQLANPDGSAVDGTNAEELSYAELEGRKQIVDFFDFLRSDVAGFENAYILEIAPQVGIRETRRIVGEYQLTEQDVLCCASFDDTIGVNGWPVEEHIKGDVVFRFQEIPASRGFNHLPFRMILPRRIDNLLVAGRCASMTHGGQSAARVSGACFVMGEAAGTAASMSVRGEKPVRSIDVRELQSTLAANGVYLGQDIE
jgi:hypothetical protein